MLQRTESLPSQQGNNDTTVTTCSSTAGMYAAIDSHKSSCCHRSIGPIEPSSAANPPEFRPTHTSERKAHFCDEDCGRRLRRRCQHRHRNRHRCQHRHRHRHRHVLPSGRALLLLIALVFVWTEFVVDDHNEGSVSRVGEGGRNMAVAIVDAVRTPVALAFSSPPPRASSRQSLNRNKIDIDIGIGIDIGIDGVTSITRQGHGTSPLIPHVFQLRSSVLKGTAGDDASESTAATTTTTTTTTTTSTVNDSGVSYEVRDCQYQELKQVAALVVESFYDKKSTNIVTRNLYKLAELNRLQQNYAYPESRTAHRMLVVEAKITQQKETETSELVGFCDVDARPCKTQLRLPRPYLSDLAVDPGHRRQGLARKLVEASERFILERGSRGGGVGDDDDDDNVIDGGAGDDALWLWIRVEETNEAAIGLYQDRLGYVRTQWSVTDTSLPVDAQARIEAQANNNKNNNSSSSSNKNKNNNNNKKNEPSVWTLRKDLRGSGADADSTTASLSLSSGSGSGDDDSQRDSSSSAASDHDDDDGNYVI